MLLDLIVSESIIIDVEVSKVWEGLTKPEIIKEYLFGCETITDWKVGSEIIFQGEYEGHKYRDGGVIQEIVWKELLSYSYFSNFSGLEDKPENYSLITYTLKSIDDNKTEFTWIQKGYGDEQGYEHSKNGMEEFLEKIKEVIER